MSTRLGTYVHFWRPSPRERTRWTGSRVFHLLVLALIGSWVLLPLLIMLATSLKTQQQLTTDVTGLIPQPFTLKNYTDVLTNGQFPIGRWFLNSAVSVLGGTLLTLLVASLAAYGLSRLQWPGRDAVFYTILASTLIPGVAFIIPVFKEFADANLLNTYWPIILVYPAGAFGVFMLRQFYLSVPRELEEAAVIDGAGKFRRWAQIILPMMRTPILTLAVLSAVGIYNDFIWPLIAMQTNDMYTITVGIAIATEGSLVNDYGPLMAFSTMAAIPTVVLFIILQRYFVGSAALSGVKG